MLSKTVENVNYYLKLRVKAKLNIHNYVFRFLIYVKPRLRRNLIEQTAITSKCHRENTVTLNLIEQTPDFLKISMIKPLL